VSLHVFFQVLVEVQKRPVALKAMVASENRLSGHQLNTVVLTDVRAIFNRPEKLLFA
jgi:hypothetical protein